jgi:hypothetical protein
MREPIQAGQAVNQLKDFDVRFSAASWGTPDIKRALIRVAPIYEYTP